MKNTLNTLYTFLFVWEKDRYYYRGALRWPERITQEFWDELMERRRQYDQQDGEFFRVDTTFATGRPDFFEYLGPRPRVPTGIKRLRKDIYAAFNFICLLVMIYILATR